MRLTLGLHRRRHRCHSTRSIGPTVTTGEAARGSCVRWSAKMGRVLTIWYMLCRHLERLPPARFRWKGCKGQPVEEDVKNHTAPRDQRRQRRGARPPPDIAASETLLLLLLLLQKVTSKKQKHNSNLTHKAIDLLNNNQQERRGDPPNTHLLSHISLSEAKVQKEIYFYACTLIINKSFFLKERGRQKETGLIRITYV